MYPQKPSLKSNATGMDQRPINPDSLPSRCMMFRVTAHHDMNPLKHRDRTNFSGTSGLQKKKALTPSAFAMKQRMPVM